MLKRRQTNIVNVGGLAIGGTNPIRVQSMTTTDTNDIEASLAQAKRIIAAGGELVRLTTQGRREAESIGKIRAALRTEGINTPLVADVHFNANVADIAAQNCDKVRINPGNYVSDAEEIEERLVPLIGICRRYNTALRIGVNHGSLSKRIMDKYGDTPEGIVESCMEFLRICKKEDFNNVVLSIKASNTVVMVQSVRLLVKTMDKARMHYPLHLGVTEAGEGEDGRIKSAVGIGALLTEGIGDTIRVSLSEEPECEIPVARKLVDFAEECAQLREDAVIKRGVLHLDFTDETEEDLMLKAAMTAGALLIDGKANELVVTNNGKAHISLADDILQAARVKFCKTEYISCPSCGRTLYDLKGTIARVKEAVAKAAIDHPQLNSLKIGIMGCIVNGPGEMADADYGYVGAGPGKISLFKGKECVEKAIPEEEAVEHLLQLILNEA